MEFKKEINPNKESTVLTITGSGIIKRVEMLTSESSNSSIVLTIDKTAYTSFAMLREPNKSSEENHNMQRHTALKIEVNLDRLFHKEFSLFIDNRSDAPFNSTGKIFYEIKKPLTETLRHMI